MKLSVIIPVFNGEKYLPACIESVCAQTYRDLQIILINDGSGDSSGKICDAYAQKDPRITVIHQENAGVSAARNAGLRVATGDLVAFADADDYLDGDMYGFLIDLMQTHDADIVHCGYRRIVGGSVELEQNTGELYIQNREEALFCMIAGKVFHCGLWNKLYRRQVIEGLTFDVKLKINEDILFNFQAFARSDRLVYLDVSKYNYVVHPASACNATAELNKALDSCEVNREMLKRLSGSSLEAVARSRYMRSLSICYREYAKGKNAGFREKRKSTAKAIWAEAKTKRASESRMVLTAYLIRWMPWAYMLIYVVYDRIRKPRWEPQKL